MGGGVLSQNLLLMFDRYIKRNVSVSIKILNPNLPVFCWVKSSKQRINLFYMKIKKMVVCVYKAIFAC